MLILGIETATERVSVAMGGHEGVQVFFISERAGVILIREQHYAVDTLRQEVLFGYPVREVETVFQGALPIRLQPVDDVYKALLLQARHRFTAYLRGTRRGDDRDTIPRFQVPAQHPQALFEQGQLSGGRHGAGEVDQQQNVGVATTEVAVYISIGLLMAGLLG